MLDQTLIHHVVDSLIQIHVDNTVGLHAKKIGSASCALVVSMVGLDLTHDLHQRHTNELLSHVYHDHNLRYMLRFQ